MPINDFAGGTGPGGEVTGQAGAAGAGPGAAAPAAGQPTPGQPTPGQPTPGQPTPGQPSLQAFLSAGEDHRLRDLLAFGMAVEAGKPVAAGTVDTLRRQADAALEAYAFRSLHNRVEEIRRAAVDEQLGRLRQAPGFQGIVVANLVAMITAAMLGVLAWWLHALYLTGA